MCKNNADCGEDGGKCCFNGCQKDCVKFGKSLDATGFIVEKLLHSHTYNLYLNTMKNSNLTSLWGRVLKNRHRHCIR